MTLGGCDASMRSAGLDSWESGACISLVWDWAKDSPGQYGRPSMILGWRVRLSCRIMVPETSGICPTCWVQGLVLQDVFAAVGGSILGSSTSRLGCSFSLTLQGPTVDAGGRGDRYRPDEVKPVSFFLASQLGFRAGCMGISLSAEPLTPS